jgi:hypothetical protein
VSAPNPHSIAGTTLAITQTLTVWSVLMPPITEVRENTPGRSPTFTDDMRQTEAVAGTVAVGIGYLMTKLTNTWEPLVYSAMFVTLLIMAYEYVLHTDNRHLSVIRKAETA